MPILDGWGHMDGWGWVVGSLMMLLVWGSIIWGAILLLRRPHALRADPDDAEAVLRRRYAAGEIDAEEFRKRMEELRKG